MKKYLTLLMLCVIVFIGCTTTVIGTTVYPITTKDIETLPKGTSCNVSEYQIEQDDGTTQVIQSHEFLVEKDGIFVSDFYVNEIMEAKIKK